MKPVKVISGGQTGADRTALITAQELGIQTGGWAPKGYLTEIGPDPSLAEFGLLEHSSSNYPPRTRANVRESDGTIWFGESDSAGFKCTLRAVDDYGKPFLNNPTASVLIGWINAHKIKVLNVAGNRMSMNPSVCRHVKQVLCEAFK